MLSLRWSYLVWKRRRWRDDEELIGRISKRAVEDLGQFGLSASDLNDIGESDVVEVGLPSESRALHAARNISIRIVGVLNSRRAGSGFRIVGRIKLGERRRSLFLG
jgi:hypothetical protein